MLKVSVCGNGKREEGEGCDDGIVDWHGCKEDCSGPREEWFCWGGSLTTADACVHNCHKNGNYLKNTKPNRACDDGNKDSRDGCSSSCEIESGYTCRKYKDVWDKCEWTTSWDLEESP